MQREDKEMRGHTNVIMHKRLINSFFTFLRLGDFHLASPEGENADIQVEEDAHVCFRGTITLLWDIYLLIYLKDITKKNNSPTPGSRSGLNTTAFTSNSDRFHVKYMKRSISTK